MGDELYIFPNFFSENAIKQILLYGKQDTLHVYRVGKYGKDKATAFLNYYDEVVKGLKTVRNPEKYLEKCKNNIDMLSISCYYNIEDIRYYFQITLKDDYPERILLEGFSDSKYGLTQKTSERKETVTNSHTDWWLYKDATPWEIFNIVNQ